MDALSDVLSIFRVSSTLSSRFEGRGAWAFRFPAYSHIKFGGVLAGRFHLWIEDAWPPLTLEEGDFYMLTSGQPFCSASDPSRSPLDGPQVYRSIRSNDGVVRYQGDCAEHYPAVSLASGRFTFEDDVNEILLRHLPPIIHLRRNDAGTTALSLLLDLLKGEVSEMQPGAEVAQSSLAALVLVNVLRAYLKVTPSPPGWLGALADPRIGKVLSLMHGRPGERWTVDQLASVANMSRTAFSTHFRRLVGNPPLDYLNQWRMTVARTALRHSEESLVDIAERIGYQSDTAFSIAFKRWSGQSPGRFRTQSRMAAPSKDEHPPRAL